LIASLLPPPTMSYGLGPAQNTHSNRPKRRRPEELAEESSVSHSESPSLMQAPLIHAPIPSRHLLAEQFQPDDHALDTFLSFYSQPRMKRRRLGEFDEAESSHPESYQRPPSSRSFMLPQPRTGQQSRVSYQSENIYRLPRGDLALFNENQAAPLYRTGSSYLTAPSAPVEYTSVVHHTPTHHLLAFPIPRGYDTKTSEVDSLSRNPAIKRSDNEFFDFAGSRTRSSVGLMEHIAPGRYTGPPTLNNPTLRFSSHGKHSSLYAPIAGPSYSNVPDPAVTWSRAHAPTSSNTPFMIDFPPDTAGYRTDHQKHTSWPDKLSQTTNPLVTPSSSYERSGLLGSTPFHSDTGSSLSQNFHGTRQAVYDVPSSTHIYPSICNSRADHWLAAQEVTGGLASSFDDPGGTAVHIQDTTMTAGRDILSNNTTNNYHEDISRRIVRDLVYSCDGCFELSRLHRKRRWVPTW
jgi:hypothetical protein